MAVEIKLVMTDEMIEQFGRDLILRKITGNFHPEVDMIDQLALTISRQLAKELRNLIQ